NTLSPVDFDQFLSALDPETRTRLQTLMQQAGGGLQGRQETINDLLAQLKGLSQESVAQLSTFHQHDPDIDRIVANLAIVSDRLAQSHQQLGDLVGSMSDVTGTLAKNDRALASLLTHLGNVMGDFDATLNGNAQNFHTTIVTLHPLPSLPSLPLPKCLKTPTPPAPTLSPLPCPSVSPPAVPTVPCAPATPTPPKLPVPTPTPSLCPSLPGLSLPLGALPGWLMLLLY